MRPFPLTVMKGGINRLRVKGAARADMLYDLLNAYVTNAGSITGREGTIRQASVDTSTKGLMAMDGSLHIFGTTSVAVPPGYTLDLLIHPTDPTQTLSKIWFAKPFMGFPYVVAQYANGDIYNFWLQSSGSWTANTVYFNGNIVTPDTPNGLAYAATRNMKPNPVWSASAIHVAGDLIEPTTYTGFAYRAIAVSSSPGTSAFSGSTEPTWPTVEGGTIQEFGNFNTVGSNNSSTTSSKSPLSTNITDRYGDSIDIAGQTGSASTLTIPTASNVVTTWQPGTLYAPGAVVKPGTNQGAFINAIPNGDFEAGDDGNWVKTSGASISVATGGATPYQGTYMGLLSCNHSTETLTMNTYGTVTPGQAVTASAYVSTDASGSDLESWIILRWYDNSDTFLSATTSTGQFGNGSTNNYKKISVTGNAPASATRCRVQLKSANGTSTRDSQWDLVVWSLEQPAAVSNFLYEAVQSNAATSGSSQPAWPTTAGNTVVDGGVTWEAIGTSIITWQAIPIMQSGSSQPTFPTVVGSSVNDPSTYTSKDGHSTDTSMSWTCVNRMITDSKCPNNPAVALGASHVFEGDTDIVDFSAAVDPTDWSSANNAGYLPTGLNNYGDNPAKVLALYRSNLMAFNASGYQMWQIDPDPQNMALLDAQPIGSIYTQAAQSVANDLMFLTEVGVRNIGTVGATANMQIGNTGQPIDPLVVAQLKAGTYYPISLYYPGRGQYWLIFGPQAFVLTINGASTRSWSRYVFPDTITDWAINNSILYLRSAGSLVWQLDASTTQDDQGAVFTASLSGGTMTVSAVASGTLVPGQQFTTSPGWLQMVASSVSTPAPNGMQGLSSSVAALISNGGKSVYTSDGGNTWNVVNTPAFGGGYGGSAGCANDGTNILASFGFTNSAVMLRSTNGGATWSTITMPSGCAPMDGVYYLPTAGLFVAFNSITPAVAWSSDGGATWTKVVQADFFVCSVAQDRNEPVCDNGAGVYVRVGNISGGNGAIQSSTDGKTWTTRFNSGATPFTSITWDGDVFLAGRGSQIYTSPDGITWTLNTNSVSATYAASIAFNLVALGPGGSNQVNVSQDDGATWTLITIPIVADRLQVVGSKLYAIGAGIASSSDGITWTTELAALNFNLTTMNGVWAAGLDSNNNSVIYTSQAAQNVHISGYGTGKGGTGTYTVDSNVTSSGTFTTGGADVNFSGVIQWPYLEQAAMGVNKMLLGVDLIGDGAVTIQIAYREDDKTTFSDNAGFGTSLNVTAPYAVQAADTIPGNPIPIPVDAPSYSLILTWAPNQTWVWDAANFYVTDNTGRGFR